MPVTAEPPSSSEAAAADDEIEAGDGAESTDSAIAVAGTVGEDSSGAADTEASSTVSTDPPLPPPSTSNQKRSEMTPDRSASGNIHRPKQAPESGQRLGSAPPPPPPAATGTIVVAVGEELFAREAETVMEEALARAGLEVVDEYSIPGASAIISGTAERDPGELHRLLRPHARNAVVIRVEYLGERQLTYMGQRDVAFQSRVTVVPIDLAGGKPVQQPSRFRVEYTHLNVERVAQEKMRAESRQVAELFGGR
jgi:hypothetical protein